MSDRHWFSKTCRSRRYAYLILQSYFLYQRSYSHAASLVSIMVLFTNVKGVCIIATDLSYSLPLVASVANAWMRIHCLIRSDFDLLNRRSTRAYISPHPIGWISWLEEACKSEISLLIAFTKGSYALKQTVRFNWNH